MRSTLFGAFLLLALVPPASAQFLGFPLFVDPDAKAPPPAWLKDLPPENAAAAERLVAQNAAQAGEIKGFACDFERWEYNPQWGPKDPNVAFTYATGKLQFEKPSKGLLQVERLGYYTAAKGAGMHPTYEPRRGEAGEHWAWDQETWWEFLPNQQTLRETKVPPDAKRFLGFYLAELPFLFVTDRAGLQDCFWIRVITPPDDRKHHWLELFPKTKREQASVKRMEAMFPAGEAFPTALQIYLPDGRGRVVYQFAQQRLNPTEGWTKPVLPEGWRKDVIP